MGKKLNFENIYSQEIIKEKVINYKNETIFLEN
jgi:hypothetical protein